MNADPTYERVIIVLGKELHLFISTIIYITLQHNIILYNLQMQIGNLKLNKVKLTKVKLNKELN